MLTWIFGEVKINKVHLIRPDKAAGFLHLEKAKVRWFLSLDYNDVPTKVKEKGIRTYRSLMMDSQEIEFSEGFTDLHTESYREILANKGFGLMDSKHSVAIVHEIRNAQPIGIKGDYHPILKNLSL
jgi:UDP-N-acetyl-2-amino-2-deoxyglucuronate dehydrogenase